MPDLMTMAAQLLPTAAADGDTGAATARALIVPWGVPIVHNGQRIMFARGSIAWDSAGVPLNVDHGDGVVERIGKVVELEDTPAGLVGSLRISDTALGRDVATLLRDGVVEDVSAGVRIVDSTEGAGGVLMQTGILDHTAVVGRGAFGHAGSKVLEVHNHQEDDMDETTATDVATDDAGAADDVATLAADELGAEVIELRATVAQLAEAIAAGQVQVNQPSPIEQLTLDEYLRARFALETGRDVKGATAANMELVQLALADVTTTSVAGIVPDYQSSEIISIIDTDRAFLGSIPRDPIGDEGMTVDYPEVTQKPTVGKQATQKTEVSSQELTVGVKAIGLDTWAGAADVAIQVLERSSVNFVELLFREFAHVYATATDANGIAVAKAAVPAAHSAVLADLGADADATKAAVLAANTLVIADVRRPINIGWLAPNRWEQLLSLNDTTKRPLVTFPESQSVNAEGQVAASAMRCTYLGIDWYLVPDAAAHTCVMGRRERSVANIEQTPQRLQAVQVSLLGYDMGIYAYQATAVKYPNGLAELTEA